MSIYLKSFVRDLNTWIDIIIFDLIVGLFSRSQLEQFSAYHHAKAKKLQIAKKHEKDAEFHFQAKMVKWSNKLSIMRTLQSLILLSLTLPSCLSLTTSRNGHLQCEHYDKQCIDEANNNGQNSGDILKKCSGIETCENDESVCYTTWDAQERNLTDFIKEGRRHVHKMGCISNQVIIPDFLVKTTWKWKTATVWRIFSIK